MKKPIKKPKAVEKDFDKKKPKAPVKKSLDESKKTKYAKKNFFVDDEDEDADDPESLDVGGIAPIDEFDDDDDDDF